MPIIVAGNVITSASQVQAGVINSTGILDGSIMNADINAAAAIDQSKLANAAKSGANSDITSLASLSTPLSVAQGGTGLATITAHKLLVGNGAGAPTILPDTTAGTVLTSNGAAADPTFQTAPGGMYGAASTTVQYTDNTEISGSGNSGSKTFKLLVPATCKIQADAKQDTDTTGSPVLTVTSIYPHVTTAQTLASIASTSYATYSGTLFLTPGQYSVQVTSSNGRTDWMKNMTVQFTPTLIGTTYCI